MNPACTNPATTSTNAIKIFENPEFGRIRTLEKDGEPWFVGKDVAGVLGYERPDNAIRKHVDDEDKLTHQIGASGQNRNMTIINESGLYSLILSSKLPTAKRFKHWGTSEVLPSIRKHGAYMTPATTPLLNCANYPTKSQNMYNNIELLHKMSEETNGIEGIVYVKIHNNKQI